MNTSVRFIWIFIFLIPFLQGFGCGDDRLVFVNNSDIDIYIRWSCDRELTELKILRPDYFWIDHLDDTVYVKEQIIRKGSSEKIITRGSWPNNIRECENEKIFLFIFSDSIIMNYSDQEIIEDEIFEKRLEFTLDELKKNNWEITFP